VFFWKQYRPKGQSLIMVDSLTEKPTIPTVPTALSAFTKDINFDEKYYTESEINTLIQGTNNPMYKGDISGRNKKP